MSGVSQYKPLKIANSFHSILMALKGCTPNLILLLMLCFETEKQGFVESQTKKSKLFKDANMMHLLLKRRNIRLKIREMQISGNKEC